MKKTNFDQYLEEQMKDPSMAARIANAGEAWEVALQIAALRQQAGLSIISEPTESEASMQVAEESAPYPSEEDTKGS